MDQVPPYCNQYHHCQVYLSEEVEKSGWLYKQGLIDTSARTLPARAGA
jgi:hypothetical protein